MRRARPILAGLVTALLLSACATLPSQTEPAAGIGPYQAVTARLLVIEPTRRWQVMLDWQADSPVSGHARLTHAATGTVVELTWQRDDIRLRDSSDPVWRKVTMAQLADQGIVVSPYTLSRFLTGRVPSGFIATGPDAWERKDADNLIRVSWDGDAQRLVMIDIRHGRKATLIVRDAIPISGVPGA